MSIRTGTNIAALAALRRLGQTTDKLQSVAERLSSGMRINRASDDPAGIAIADTLNAQSRVYTQGIRNLNDGISLLNVADGALASLSDITIRIQELAEQAANGTYSSAQRTALNREAQALVSEYNRITQTTKFNNISLLPDSATDLRIQDGYGVNGSIKLTLQGAGISAVDGDLEGDGTFDAAQLFPDGHHLFGASSGDVNRDGKVDLVFGTVDGGGPDGGVMLLGNGDGTFQAPVNLNLGGPYTGQISLGDLNEDGKLDLIGSVRDAPSIAIQFGNGDGTFGATSFLTPGDPAQIFGTHVADFNSDSNLDILTYGSYLHLGNGLGGFAAPVFLNRPANAVADVNGDGKLDLLGALATVSLGNGDGTFGASVIYDNIGSESGFAMGDFDNDGDLDWFRSDPSQGFRILRNNGSGSFAFTGMIAGATFGSIPTFAGDLNGDGNGDVLVNSGNSIQLYFGNGDLTFDAPVSLAAAATPLYAFALDINDDGVKDLISVNGVFDSHISVLMGNGSASADFPEINISTQSGARDALGTVQALRDTISTQRGNVGASVSRMEFALRASTAKVENLQASRARIVDADIASEFAQYTRLSILQQAGAAVLAQANLDSALVLKLLKTE